MKRFILAVLLIASRIAHGAQGVTLQPTTPGAVQTGHFHISGWGLVDRLLVGPASSYGDGLTLVSTSGGNDAEIYAQNGAAFSDHIVQPTSAHEQFNDGINDSLFLNAHAGTGRIEYLVSSVTKFNLSRTGDALFAGTVTAARFAGPLSGNANTATALAADPADCTLPNVALGINANGTAQCAQPTSISGNSNTATALAADPTDCSPGLYANSIAANGNLGCSQVAYSQVTGTPNTAETHYIRPDRNLSLTTGYEFSPRYAPGFLLLKQNRQWVQTIANAVSTPPNGWITWLRTTNLVSADVNTTHANGFNLKHDGTSTDDMINATLTSPLIYRTYSSSPSGFDVVFHVGLSATGTNNAGAVVFQDDANLTTWFGLGIDGSAPQLQFIKTIAGTSTITNVGITSEQATTGIWFHIIKGHTTVQWWYSTSSSATPPTTWTLGSSVVTGIFTQDVQALRVGLTIKRFAVGSASQISFWSDYFDDSSLLTTSVLTPWAATNPADLVLSANGFLSTNPTQPIVASFDLGASTATVSNADVQAALAQVTNTRALDSATITWGVVRGTANPACSPSTSADSTTVSGSGEFLAVCAAMSSTGGLLPGSINLTDFSIPFKP